VEGGAIPFVYHPTVKMAGGETEGGAIQIGLGTTVRMAGGASEGGPMGVSEVAQPGAILAFTYVEAQESTTSAGPVDLTTHQALQFTLDVQRTVLIRCGTYYYNPTQASGIGKMGFTLQGTLYWCCQIAVPGVSAPETESGFRVFTLPAGTYNLPVQFGVSTGTGTFGLRYADVTLLA
jgi:hypothetical protein